MRRRLPLVGGIAGAAIGGVLVLAVVLVVAAGRSYRVTSEAMEPSLRSGDHVLALRLWGPVEPEEGEVVVYRIPEEGVARCGAGGSYIHRVTRLTAEGYFVQGDNRLFSCDSRVFGPVPEDRVAGEVVAVVWPPSRWGLR